MISWAYHCSLGGTYQFCVRLLFLDAGRFFETDSQYRRKTKKPPFGGSSHLIVKITHINVKLTTN